MSPKTWHVSSAPGPSLPLNFFFKLIYFFWLCWVFVATCGLSLVAVSGGYSVAVGGLLIAVASLVAEHGL